MLTKGSARPFKYGQSSYCYQGLVLRKPDKYTELRKDIRNAFEDSSKRYGYRRLHAVLTTDGRTIFEKIVRRIMSEEGLFVYQKRHLQVQLIQGEKSVLQ